MERPTRPTVGGNSEGVRHHTRNFEPVTNTMRELCDGFGNKNLVMSPLQPVGVDIFLRLRRREDDDSIFIGKG